jgi:uncharacterized small protein (DUF1192 family)
MRDDDPFAKPEPRVLPLAEMSIEDLEARILDLKAQIATCEDLISSKRASRSAADAFFSRKG